MITFYYQGRQIEGERVNVDDGALLVAVRDDYQIIHQGREELLRDAAGHYYLRRKLELWDADGSFEHRASGRTHVHRLSLTAAVQWATMRCWAETHDLRRDVTAALTASRPRLAAAGSDEVTVPLTLPLDLYRRILAMGAYDEHSGFSATVTESMEGDVDSWLAADDHCDPTPPEFLAQYEAALDAGQHPEVWPPRPWTHPTLSSLDWLDDHAATLIHERLTEEPGLEVGDILNGALRFFLENPEGEGVPWENNHQAVAEAKRDRLETGRREPAPTVFLRLDAEASEKLTAYRKITGRELADIASGACISSVRAALEYQNSPTEPEWYFLAGEIDEAAARRVQAGTPSTSSTSGFQSAGSEAVDLGLETFFAKLLDAFCRRWKIDPTVFMRAAVQDRVEATFSNQSEEYWAVRHLREAGTLDGHLMGALSADHKRRMLFQAGLTPDDLDPEEKTTLQLTTKEGRYLADLNLTDAQLAFIRAHAQERGLDFAAAVNAVLSEGFKRIDPLRPDLAARPAPDDAPLEMVDLRDLPAADRPDAALCAAGAVEAVDEEEERPETTSVPFAGTIQSEDFKALLASGEVNLHGKLDAEGNVQPLPPPADDEAQGGKEGK